MTHPPNRSRTLARTTAGAVLAIALGGGCASVPEVESRLQSLRFHPNMYVVRAGDTLETIAFRYELSGEQLTALNPGVPSGTLPPGLRINVRPGTDLAESVRARAGRAGAARTASASLPATEAAPSPTVSTAVTRAVPRSVLAAPVPIETPAATARARGTASAPAETADAFAEKRAYGGGAPDIVTANHAREPAAGRPREEVLPDDYDIDPDAAARATLDGELQRYVGRWTWPTEGQVARDYAPERVGGQGIDIAGLPGQDVRAALEGTVVYSGRDLSGGGSLVIVRHDEGLMTTYSHVDDLFVAEDDRVLAGDAIANLGWNENRESVLGFEVRRDGNPLDPTTFLPPR